MTAADRPSVTDDARAETTTATVEDIADALEHWDRGIDWRLAEQENLTRAAYLRGAEQLMSLLATARTRPTRDDLARAIASGYETDHPTPNRHDYRAADAVLELLRDGAR